LTDHYNPAEKTINLSQEVYNGRSISAAAVAAHECGHAVQHAKAYAWLGLRSNLVPVVSFASKWVQWILLAGILMVRTFPALLLAGIILFALTTLSALYTACWNRCKPEALTWLSMPVSLLPESCTGTGCSKMGCIYICYCCSRIAGNITVLYNIFTGSRR